MFMATVSLGQRSMLPKRDREPFTLTFTADGDSKPRASLESPVHLTCMSLGHDGWLGCLGLLLKTKLFYTIRTKLKKQTHCVGISAVKAT